MTSNPIVETTAVHYAFAPGVKTLQDINLHIDKGSIYGFLGPNGAGKTTTLRLLLGLLKQQEGKIRIFGMDIATQRLEILRKLGSLIEQPSLYGHLSARENLEVYRNVYGAAKERITEVLHMTDLAHTGSKKAKQFSLGMKQRLSIALALLSSPELLILDEPTNGLDPNGIIETRELLKTLNRQHGVTILVSSHILAEIERMATHVGIIHKGKMVFQGTLSALQQLQLSQRMLQVDTSDNMRALQLFDGHGAQHQNGYMVLPYSGRTEAARVARVLHDNGMDIFMLQPQQNDLEQLFMDITSRNQ